MKDLEDIKKEMRQSLLLNNALNRYMVERATGKTKKFTNSNDIALWVSRFLKE